MLKLWAAILTPTPMVANRSEANNIHTACIAVLLVKFGLQRDQRLFR